MNCSNTNTHQSTTQAQGIINQGNPTSSNTNKSVAFSVYSQLHVYPEIQDKKCYSSTERKSLQYQALCDAFKVKTLIKFSPYKGGDAIQYLIEKKLLSSEDLLGIEHLIMDSQKVKIERQKHSKLVMKAQQGLNNAKDEDAALKLAYVATKKSLKASQKARLRAALAA